MGFSFRGRSKGSGSWFNYSASKRGAHASVSAKLSKNITANIGSRGEKRVTVNFGHGFRWVKNFGSSGGKSNNYSGSYLSDYDDVEDDGRPKIWTILGNILGVPSTLYLTLCGGAYLGVHWYLPILAYLIASIPYLLAVRISTDEFGDTDPELYFMPSAFLAFTPFGWAFIALLYAIMFIGASNPVVW